MAVPLITPKSLIATKELEPPTPWQNLAEKDIKDEFSDLARLKYKDINWRLKNRQSIRNFLFILLAAQNLLVFAIFALGLWFNKIAGLENVFSVLIGGTLTETTGLIYIIVKWLFSEIPYEQKPT